MFSVEGMDIILGGLSMSKDNSDFFKQKNSWSLIKDRLLSGYLAPYMQKVLTTNKKICYVDCFLVKENLMMDSLDRL